MLKGRILPFYALLRMSTEPKGVPEWETYANPRVKKGTAKLIPNKLISLPDKLYRLQPITGGQK